MDHAVFLYAMHIIWFCHSIRYRDKIIIPLKDKIRHTGDRSWIGYNGTVQFGFVLNF